VHAVPRFDIRAPRRNDIHLQRFHFGVTVRVGEDLAAVAACILTLTGNLMERRRGRPARHTRYAAATRAGRAERARAIT
jgi:hypothetical protein